MYGIKCLGEIYEQLCCFEILCTNFFDDSTDNQNLWSCGSFSPRTVLIFPENFLDCEFDAVEKQSIINLSSYKCKCYISVVLKDSKATFLWEGEDAAFCPFLFCVLFIDSVAKPKKYVIKIPSLPYFWGYFVEACSFSVFDFCHYYVKFFLHKLSLMDVLLAINKFCDWFINDLSGVSK